MRQFDVISEPPGKYTVTEMKDGKPVGEPFGVFWGSDRDQAYELVGKLLQAEYNSIEKPHRRHEMVLQIGADDKDSLVAALRQIAFEIDTHGIREDVKHHSVSGGPSWGHILDIDTDLSMDHEKYLKAIEEWTQARWGESST